MGNVTRSSPEICVHLKHDGQTIKMTKEQYDVKLFRVDDTFDAVASQRDVYNSSLKRIVLDVLNGYNGTVMAYGQTGSGKSYTMFGKEGDPGIVQLTVNDVFGAVRMHLDKKLVANVYLSFYQLYMEQAYDLLAKPEYKAGRYEFPALSIREDATKGAFVENLLYLYVDDEASTMDALRQGLKNRKVQGTQYNMSSSRSHAIFQMYLDFEVEENERDKPSSKNAYGGSVHSWNGDSDGGGKKFDVRRQILTFVDLAGSERAMSYHAAKSKTQMKESVIINKSISALGNCIQALASISNPQVNPDEVNSFRNGGSKQRQKHMHIPFRDCKLTWLLAEPLGGNSKTCIIANIGPCYYNYEETKATLKFAQRYVP
jgi:hypothetical protein